MACSAVFGCLTFLILVAYVGVLILPWAPWAKFNFSDHSEKRIFSFQDSDSMFQRRGLIFPICDFHKKHAESMDNIFEQFGELSGQGTYGSNDVAHQQDLKQYLSKLGDEVAYVDCIERKSFEKIALGLVILTSLAMFLALPLTCAICCNCCRTKCPAVCLAVLIGISALMMLGTVVVYGVRLESEFKSWMTFDVGYFIGVGVALLILLMFIIAAMAICLQGDLVRYSKPPLSVYPMMSITPYYVAPQPGMGPESVGSVAGSGNYPTGGVEPPPASMPEKVEVEELDKEV